MELFPGLTQSMSFFFCKAMDNVVSYHHEFLMPEHLLLSVRNSTRGLSSRSAFPKNSLM